MIDDDEVPQGVSFLSGRVPQWDKWGTTCVPIIHGGTYPSSSTLLLTVPRLDLDSNQQRMGPSRDPGTF